MGPLQDRPQMTGVEPQLDSRAPTSQHPHKTAAKRNSTHCTHAETSNVLHRTAATQLKEGVAATHVTGACVENKQNIDKTRVHSAQHKACRQQ